MQALNRKRKTLTTVQNIQFAYGATSQGGCIKISDYKIVHKYKTTFKEWYDPDMDHRKISPFLARFCTKHFDTWWPNFDCHTGIIDLLLYCGKWFDTWWPHVEHKIDWETDKRKRDWCGRNMQLYRSKPIIALMMGCHQHMNKWWEPAKINWRLHSKFLAWHCCREFDIWWDYNKFNYDAARWLVRYCPDKWDVWWDIDKISYRRASGMLCQFHSHRFDIWWEPKRFNWGIAKQFLIKYCSDQTKEWFDETKFSFNHYEYDLFHQHCAESKDIWVPAAMLRRLELEGHHAENEMV